MQFQERFNRLLRVGRYVGLRRVDARGVLPLPAEPLPEQLRRLGDAPALPRRELAINHLFSCLLSLALALSLFPARALAADSSNLFVWAAEFFGPLAQFLDDGLITIGQDEFVQAVSAQIDDTASVSTFRAFARGLTDLGYPAYDAANDAVNSLDDSSGGAFYSLPLTTSNIISVGALLDEWWAYAVTHTADDYPGSPGSDSSFNPPSIPSNNSVLYVIHARNLSDSLVAPDGVTLDVSSVAEMYNSTSYHPIIIFDSYSNGLPKISGAYAVPSQWSLQFYDAYPTERDVVALSDDSSGPYISLTSGSLSSVSYSKPLSYFNTFGYSLAYRFITINFGSHVSYCIFRDTLAYNDTIFDPGLVNPDPEPTGPPVPPDYVQPTPGSPIAPGTTTDTGFNLDLSEVINWLKTINDNLVAFFEYFKNYVNWLDDWFSDFRVDFSSIIDLLRQIRDWTRNIFRNMRPGYRPSPVDDGDGFLDWLRDFLTRYYGELPNDLSQLLIDLSGIKERFPFSVPWDIAAVLGLLVHDPVTPSYTFTLPLPTGSYDVVVDLAPFDDVAALARRAETVLFGLGLMLRTNWLLDIISPKRTKG